MFHVKVSIDSTESSVEELSKVEKLAIASEFLTEAQFRRACVSEEAIEVAEYLGLGTFRNERDAVKAISSNNK